MAPFSSINPANGDIIWTGTECCEAEVHDAVGRAKKAFHAFSMLSLDDRIAFLKAFENKLIEKQEELAHAITQENGKPRWEAMLEVKTAISKIDISIQAYYDRTPIKDGMIKDGHMVTRHHPQGVLGVMSPFNFPIHLAHGHIIPALLAGNTIVLKPSELVPMCAELYVRYWKEINLPDGVIECIQGGPAVGAALVAHPDLNGLLFTGSEAVGKKIHAQFGGHPEKMLALEMGGNNPLIILDVPNEKAAVNVVLQSAYITSGQRCTCARRLIVKRTPETERLIQAVIHAIPFLQIGDGANDPFMGPLISNAAADKAMAAQAMLIDSGGIPLVEMKRPDNTKPFVTPALIDTTGINVPDEEYFCPLMKLFWVNDDEEAIRLANETRYGLSAAIICRDKSLFDDCYTRMHAGLVHWNRPTTGSVSDAPFGGVGMSGNHRPTAYYAADYCAHPVVSMQSTPDAMSIQPLPGMLL